MIFFTAVTKNNTAQKQGEDIILEGFAKGIFVPNILGEMEGFLIDGTSKLINNFCCIFYFIYLRVCVDVLLERVSNHDFVEVCSAVPHVELIEFYI